MARKDLPPKDVIEELGELEVKDLHGKPVRVGDLWQDSAVAFYFLRHYG